jgi:hypothetical protein
VTAADGVGERVVAEVVEVVVRHLAGDEDPEHKTKAVHVRLFVERRAIEHLGRHVERRADGARAIDEPLAAVANLTQAKVGDFATEIVVDEKIARLDVAVNQNRIGAMEPGEAERGLARNDHASIQGQRARLLFVTKQVLQDRSSSAR